MKKINKGKTPKFKSLKKSDRKLVEIRMKPIFKITKKRTNSQIVLKNLKLKKLSFAS